MGGELNRHEYRGRDISLMGKILLFVFVSHLFVLPEYVRELMILNLGWGNIYPLRLYTVGLPALYAFYLSRKKVGFRTPHLAAFAVLSVTFVILEFLPNREGPAGFSLADIIPFSGVLFPARGPSYSFVAEQLNIYVFFLILVNFGISKSAFYRVVDYSLCVGLIMCVITYIGYAGIINLGAKHAFFESVFFERPDTAMNADNVSYIAVFSLLLLIVKQLNEKRFSLPYMARDAFLITLFLLMVVINSSRGAFIIAMLMIAYYGLMLWRCSTASSNYRKYAAFFAVLVVAMTGLYQSFGMPEFIKRTNLYQRTFILPGEATGVNIRMESMRNSFNNFLDNPLFGVGYYSAARSGFQGTRDNNQFLQMLAGGGIFYFLIYIFYNYRFLACRARLLGKTEVMLSIVFHLIFLQFSRVVSLAMMSISAYIAFYFYYSSRRQRPAVGQTRKSVDGILLRAHEKT